MQILFFIKDWGYNIITPSIKKSPQETQQKLGGLALTLFYKMLPQRRIRVRNLKTFRELPDRKSTRLNSSHVSESRMPSSA